MVHSLARDKLHSQRYASFVHAWYQTEAINPMHASHLVQAKVCSSTPPAPIAKSRRNICKWVGVQSLVDIHSLRVGPINMWFCSDYNSIDANQCDPLSNGWDVTFAILICIGFPNTNTNVDVCVIQYRSNMREIENVTNRLNEYDFITIHFN